MVGIARQRGTRTAQSSKSRRRKAANSADAAAGYQSVIEHGAPEPARHRTMSWDIVDLARPKRFELLTPRFVVWCSIQLSYGRCLCQARTGKRGRGGRGIAKGLVRRWQGFGSARLRFDIRVGLAVPRKARRELPSDSPVDLGFRAVSEPACQARVPFTAVRTAINNSSWRL